MKIRFVILLFAFLQLNCNIKDNDIEQTWILSYLKDISDNSITQNPNSLIHFEGNQFTKTALISKEETVSTYTIQDQIIQLDTGNLGQILHLSKDSLIINDGNYICVFSSLKETSFQKNDIEKISNQLITEAWQSKINNAEMTFHCDTATWGFIFEKYDWVKLGYYSDDNSISYFDPISNNEWWTLKYFKGKILFLYSSGQMDGNYIQITESNQNQIKGLKLDDHANQWQNITLNKSEVPKDLKKLTKETFQGNWSAKILNKNKNGKTEYPVDKDEVVDGMVISGINTDTYERHLIMDYASGIFECRRLIRQVGVVNLNDLKADNLSFEFQADGKYSFKAGQKIIRKGEQWTFTRDKRYIYLDSPFSSDNFLKIVSFDGKNLEIEKIENINTGQRDPLTCFITKLKLKLTKE